MGIFQRFRGGKHTSNDTIKNTNSQDCVLDPKLENIAASGNGSDMPDSDDEKTGRKLTEKKAQSRLFYEKDNRGTRISGSANANVFFNENRALLNPRPFLAFIFEKETDALDALLAVSCIQQAADTGNLICTLPLIFGCFRREDGAFEVFLSGKELPQNLFHEARKIFSSRGRPKNEHRPERNRKFNSQNKSRITFIRQYSEITLTGTLYYREYSGKDTVTARAFLNDPGQRVTQKNHVILVKTPEGNFCRDFFGVHEFD